MDTSEQIPGHSVVAQWQPEPTRPLKVVDAEVYRAPGQPAWVIIQDATGREYEFGFDSVLRRLFAGARSEVDARAAAWIVIGSPLADEFSALVRAAALERPDWSWLTEYLEEALSWGPPRKRTAR